MFLCPSFVRVSRSAIFQHFPVLPYTLSQQEKEALDDLSTELELMDEDMIVLCVGFSLVSIIPRHPP